MSDFLSEIYSSTFKASDFMENDVEFVISGWEKKAFDNKVKIVLSFQGEQRTFVVNGTNAERIAQVTNARHPKDWIGKAITLYADKTDFGGKMVDCVRVRLPEKARKVVSRAAPRDDMNDEVPF